MSRSARTMVVFGVYLLGLGAALIPGCRLPDCVVITLAQPKVIAGCLAP